MYGTVDRGHFLASSKVGKEFVPRCILLAMVRTTDEEEWLVETLAKSGLEDLSVKVNPTADSSVCQDSNCGTSASKGMTERDNFALINRTRKTFQHPLVKRGLQSF